MDFSAIQDILDPIATFGKNIRTFVEGPIAVVNAVIDFVEGFDTLSAQTEGALTSSK